LPKEKNYCAYYTKKFEKRKIKSKKKKKKIWSIKINDVIIKILYPELKVSCFYYILNFFAKHNTKYPEKTSFLT